MRIYLKIVIITIILTSIFSYVFLDKSFAAYFATNPYGINSFFKTVTLFGDSKYYLLISLLISIIFYKFSKRVSKVAIFIFGSVAVSGILINIIKVIVARYRPPMLISSNEYGFSWFDIGYMVNSFPSGHATTAFAFYGGLSLIFPKYKTLLLLFASLIAFSRVALSVHYLSDILIGSLIGYLSAYILYEKIYKEKY